MSKRRARKLKRTPTPKIDPKRPVAQSKKLGLPPRCNNHLKIVTRVVKWLFSISSTIVFVFAVVEGVRYVRPKATVDLGGLIDSTNLLAVPITIRNNGIETITDLGISIGICKITGGASSHPIYMVADCGSTGDLHTTLVPASWQHHRLTPGDRYSISLDEFLPIPNTQYADISIAVKYCSPYFSVMCPISKQYRIEGSRQVGGQFAWKFKPND